MVKTAEAPLAEASVPSNRGHAAATSNGRWAASLAVVLFCRIILNTARRFAYPFAPFLGRVLGVPLTAVTSLIAVNQATSVIGVIFGPMADRIGYRVMMILALIILAGGMFLGAAITHYWYVMVALTLAGLAKTVFDPAIQAYAGERVPYHRRGRVIGLLEMSWAGSSLLGIPLIGVVIDRMGWPAAFGLIAAAGAIGAVGIAISLPGDGRSAAAAVPGNGWRTFLRKAVTMPHVLGTLGFVFFMSLANDNLFVIYGAWLEKSFGLSVTALGVSTTVIGVAELTGETITATLADRMGLNRAVTCGTILVMAAYAALPLCRHDLPMALAALFVLFLTFEFTIVTTLSLSTELMPEARATTMAGILAVSGIGRFVGDLIGGSMWLLGGLPACAAVSAGATALGLIALIWGFRARRKADYRSGSAPLD